MAPVGNSAITVTASSPERSLPAVAPPNLRKSASLSAESLPAPTTIRRGALRPSGARISSVDPLFPLNWLVEAARLTVPAAAPSAFWVAGPNFSVSSQNTTRTPREALENGTNPTLTASGIGKILQNPGCRGVGTRRVVLRMLAWAVMRLATSIIQQCGPQAL